MEFKTGSQDVHQSKFGFIQRSRLQFFTPEQIIRLEARSNYTLVYFTNHAPILMAKVLRVYEELLRPFGFVRTHKSHLVNSRYVAVIDRRGFVMMTDQSTAEISRRKKRDVFRMVYTNCNQNKN